MRRLWAPAAPCRTDVTALPRARSLSGPLAERARCAVRDEMAEPVDPPYKVRETAGGRHVSVTLEPIMQTAEQVLAVYQRIRSVAGLVILW